MKYHRLEISAAKCHAPICIWWTSVSIRIASNRFEDTKCRRSLNSTIIIRNRVTRITTDWWFPWLFMPTVRFYVKPGVLAFKKGIMLYLFRTLIGFFSSKVATKIRSIRVVIVFHRSVLQMTGNLLQSGLINYMIQMKWQKQRSKLYTVGKYLISLLQKFISFHKWNNRCTTFAILYYFMDLYIYIWSNVINKII